MGNQLPYIIWVEDDDDDFTFYSECLQSFFSGKVMHFKTATDALAALQQIGPTDTLPSLIVTDFYLPLFTGVELIDLIRSKTNCHDVPIALLTSSTSPSFFSQLMGVTAFEKPSTLSKAQSVMEEIIRLIQVKRSGKQQTDMSS